MVGGVADNGYVGAVWVYIRSDNGEWVQQGSSLVGNGAVGASYQGVSAALSADGNTAVVGGYADNGGVGAAWIYTRSSNGEWAQQGSKLVGSGWVGGTQQGLSVALSDDGNTAIVGGYADNGGVGAAWVYTRGSNGEWVQQGSKLVGTGAAGSSQQGYSVALSADGNTALVGGIADGGGVGATWVYARTNDGEWAQQGSKLVGSGAAGQSGQGVSVALSADGNIALIGGPGDSRLGGAAWIFARSSNSEWAQQGSKLVGAGAAGLSHQGISVALSSDGNTALVGGDSDNGYVGAAWIYIRTSDGEWAQQGSKLVGASAGSSYQGNSVALSGDGNTAIVGGYADSAGVGAAWVYARSNGEWAQHGSKLVGTGARGTVRQGFSVALSADGNTAVVGAPVDGGLAGAAWVYARRKGVWAQQGSKLVGTGAAGKSFQGLSVALSADGNTALVGADFDDGGVGAAWVYTRRNGVWSQQRSKLVGSGAVGASAQGVSVALSADGNTAIVGGRDDDDLDGAAWVFTRRNGVWVQQGSKLVGTGAAGSSLQGRSIALSADGNTALVGGVGDNGYVGAAWVYARKRGVWVQQGSKLVGTDAVGTSYQGVSVALSADGNTAIVGGYVDNAGVGAAWVYTRTKGVWAQQGPKLVGTGAENEAQQGYSVDLSADGNTAIIGAPTDNGHGGAAWVFNRRKGEWAQQGSKLVGTGVAGNRISQGYSVALSADGNTALVGGPFDNGNLGAAWVFVQGTTKPLIERVRVRGPRRLGQPQSRRTKVPLSPSFGRVTSVSADSARP